MSKVSSWLIGDVIEKLSGHDAFEEAMQEYATSTEYVESRSTWQIDGAVIASRAYDEEYGPWGAPAANQYFSRLRTRILEVRSGPNWKRFERPEETRPAIASPANNEQGTPPGRGGGSPLETIKEGPRGSASDDGLSPEELLTKVSARSHHSSRMAVSLPAGHRVSRC